MFRLRAAVPRPDVEARSGAGGAGEARAGHLDAVDVQALGGAVVGPDHVVPLAKRERVRGRRDHAHLLWHEHVEGQLPLTTAGEGQSVRTSLRHQT